MEQATLTQKVSQPPVMPKYGFIMVELQARRGKGGIGLVEDERTRDQGLELLYTGGHARIGSHGSREKLLSSGNRSCEWREGQDLG